MERAKLLSKGHYVQRLSCQAARSVRLAQRFWADATPRAPRSTRQNATTLRKLYELATLFLKDFEDFSSLNSDLILLVNESYCVLIEKVRKYFDYIDSWTIPMYYKNTFYENMLKNSMSEWGKRSMKPK